MSSRVITRVSKALELSRNPVRFSGDLFRCRWLFRGPRYTPCCDNRLLSCTSYTSTQDGWIDLVNMLCISSCISSLYTLLYWWHLHRVDILSHLGRRLFTPLPEAGSVHISPCSSCRCDIGQWHISWASTLATILSVVQTWVDSSILVFDGSSTAWNLPAQATNLLLKHALLSG
jgi:hypothetical protein